MQTIPAAIKTLLKSRSMVGANAPAATVSMILPGEGSHDPVPSGYTAVYTAADLDDVRNDLDALYIQMADIDLTAFGEWTPIGAYVPSHPETYPPFTGRYIGNGYTVSGLHITTYTTPHADTFAPGCGLFGCVSYPGVIEGVHIRDCHIDYTAPDSNAFCGAVVGFLWNGQVLECSGTGYVRGSGSGVGGLIGPVTAGLGSAFVKKSWFEGTVLSLTTSGWQVGGLIGSFGYNNGNVDGGVEDCYARITLSQAEGVSWAVAGGGGVVGHISGSYVRRVYATGTVSGTSRCGGLVGSANTSIYGTSELTASVALTTVIERLSGTEESFGRVTGYFPAEGVRDDNYALDTMVYRTTGGDSTTFPSMAATVTGKDGGDLTAAESKLQATYEALGWNFTTVWAIDPDINDGYPYLIDNPPSFPDAYRAFSVSAVTINREPAAAAQRAAVSWPNVNPYDLTDPGYYSPDRGDDDPAELNDWHGRVLPGKPIRIDLGYGTDTIRAFTGQVDDVTLDADAGTYRITLECRDAAWAIIDKTVMDGTSYQLTYTATTVEAIVSDLLVKAGVAIGDITTETTGITVAQKVFDRMTYADALAWCQTVSGFELICDESGLWSFHYPTDRQPQATDEALVLTGTTWTNLANPYVVSVSDIVRSAVSGGGTLYSRSLDYEIEYGSPARIRRRAGSAIASGATVYATYVYAAWSFEQGVDLFRLPYTISRRDIYGTIVVYGEDATATMLAATYTYTGSTDYGIPSDKVLFVELRELDTPAKCQAVADQLGNDMVTKLRQVQFAVVGNPWIQVGDCVRVRESSSTASEIYRVTSLSHSFDESGFITQFTAYHYGYTPL